MNRSASVRLVRLFASAVSTVRHCSTSKDASATPSTSTRPAVLRGVYAELYELQARSYR